MDELTELKQVIERGVDRIWMVGQPGAGKTHMTRWLGVQCSALTIHIGEALRKEYGEKFFIDHKESAAAPAELDGQVSRMIKSAVQSASDQNTVLIIDCLKHSRQVPMIPTEGKDLALVITVGPKILRERLRTATPDRKTLWVAANAEFKAHGPLLIRALENAGLPIRYVENNISRDAL